MTVAVIIQARQGSSRLPGKTLAPILGRPMLAYLLERMDRVRLADRVVVATTVLMVDGDITGLARRMGLMAYAGPVDNVLDRYLGAARMVRADVIVRVTADSTLLDPNVIDMLIARFLMGDCDYLDPGGVPNGAGAEVVSLATLERIAAAPDLTDEDREHVTLYARRRPHLFRLSRLDTNLGMDTTHWSVDEPTDLELVRRVIETLYPTTPRFTFEDVRRVLSEHPEWAAINERAPDAIDLEMLAAARARKVAMAWAPALGDL